MAYSDGEAAILTRIRAHASFDSNNAVRSDWGILNEGKNSFYAIVRPGAEPAPTEFITFSVYLVAWSTVIEIWQRYTDEATTQSNLYTRMNQVIAQMQPYRQLGLDAVQNASVTSISAPVEMWHKDGGPAWLKQEVTITWLEQSDAMTFV